MNSRTPNVIAWIDTETLGSDKPTTPIIELAVAITDTRLKLLHSKSWLFPRNIWHARLDKIDPVVIEMHAKNGLWRDLINQGAGNHVHTNGENERNIVGWITHVTKRTHGQRILVAGSGFDHFDRPIVERQLPELADILTYYSLDIGSAERLLEIVGGIKADKVETDHRAMTCVTTQIERARILVGCVQRAMGRRPTDNVLFDAEALTTPQ